MSVVHGEDNTKPCIRLEIVVGSASHPVEML